MKKILKTIFKTIFKTAHVAKNVKDKQRIYKNTIASIWLENMLEFLPFDIICSSKLTVTVFLKLCSWEIVRFSEQIMSADKYLSIFSCQMEVIVYCVVPENIHTPPTEGNGISWGVKGSIRQKKLKKCIKLNWNFQRGGELIEKIPSVGDWYGYFL